MAKRNALPRQHTGHQAECVCVCGCAVVWGLWMWLAMEGGRQQQQQQPNSCENLKPQFTHFVSLRGFISLTSKSIWLGLNFLRRFWQLFDASFATDRETERLRDREKGTERDRTDRAERPNQATNQPQTELMPTSTSSGGKVV